MSDMSSMNRERKKRQLRQQIVTPQTQPKKTAEMDGENAHKAHLTVNKRRLRIAAIILVIILAAAFGIFQYFRHYQYTDYDVVWENSISEGSFAGYLNFGDNVLKYSKDGVTYIDSQGKDVWVQSYEMKSPIAYANGNYAVIADQQGNSIYIFDKAGSQGVASTVLPILKVTVSNYGVVAAVLEDSNANYIYFFNNDGTELDIKVKCLLNGESGYPVDISLSPDGTQLIGAYSRLNNGTIYGRVAFHNFSEIGKNISTRVVGGFDDLGAGIVARVKFLTDTYSVAFSDAGIAFFSTKNVLSPELINQIKVEEVIKSVFYSNEYVGIIVENPDGENPSRMDIYRADGSKVFSTSFNYQYKYADIDGDSVILYNEDSCKVYNMSGILKFSGSFDFTVSKIRNGRYPNSLMVAGPQNMKLIKLK